MTTWIGIGSTHLYSQCGGGASLSLALDGDDMWEHNEKEQHSFVLDLKTAYLVTRVRGRSQSISDPTSVNIYVSDDIMNWGSAITGEINSWQDTDAWQERGTQKKLGRYVKVEIDNTEHRDDHINWGSPFTPFTIIDVGYELSPPMIGQQGDKWRMVSIGGTETIDKENLLFLYNGTYYTWAQAISNDNEEGSPLIVAFIYGWNVANQYYTNAQSLDPWEGFWMYHYFEGVEVFVSTESSGVVPIICIPATQINIY